eukprot:3261959-Amphidinium_carterae.1
MSFNARRDLSPAIGWTCLCGLSPLLLPSDKNGDHKFYSHPHAKRSPDQNETGTKSTQNTSDISMFAKCGVVGTFKLPWGRGGVTRSKFQSATNVTA